MSKDCELPWVSIELFDGAQMWMAMYVTLTNMVHFYMLPGRNAQTEPNGQQ